MPCSFSLWEKVRMRETLAKMGIADSLTPALSQREREQSYFYSAFVLYYSSTKITSLGFMPLRNKDDVS
jgi:hypothetical protein